MKILKVSTELWRRTKEIQRLVENDARATDLIREDADKTIEGFKI